jgi:hypothetical protein
MRARRRAQREWAAASCGESGRSAARPPAVPAAGGRSWPAGLVAVSPGAATVAAQGNDTLAQERVRGEDAVVAMAVDAGRRDEAADSGEKLEGREGEGRPGATRLRRVPGLNSQRKSAARGGGRSSMRPSCLTAPEDSRYTPSRDPSRAGSQAMRRPDAGTVGTFQVAGSPQASAAGAGAPGHGRPA